MNSTKARSGFTLIELMIAVAVLSVGLLAVITAILASVSLERQSKELTIAKNATELQMQRLRGLPFADVAALAGTTQNFEVATLKPAQGDTNGCGEITVAAHAGVVNGNLFDITVRVVWQGNRGRVQTYELAGMKSDRGVNFVGN
jgi:prepilin-type N-terminal cleavage/methylation domain-containing protein